MGAFSFALAVIVTVILCPVLALSGLWTVAAFLRLRGVDRRRRTPVVQGTIYLIGLAVVIGSFGGCSSQLVHDAAPPSVTCVVLPYHTPSVFYIPTVVPSGLKVWIAPDRPGEFTVVDSALNDLGASIFLFYQVDRLLLGGQNLGSQRFADALVHQFDTGTSFVWWRSESSYVLATFSKDF